MHLELSIAILVVTIFIVYFTRSKKTTTEGMRAINNTRLVKLYHTTWCPHCVAFMPVYKQVKLATAGSGIIYEEIDGDKEETPVGISYPTVLMIDEYGRKHNYDGDRSFDDFRNWVSQPL